MTWTPLNFRVCANRARFCSGAASVLFALLAHAQPPPASAVPPSSVTSNQESLPGFFPLRWDEGRGRLLLEIADFDQDFLYVDTLSAGLGTSRNAWLCRGEKWNQRVVSFSRVGPRVLLTQQNPSFRSDSGGAEARQTVADSFATSVLGGFEVVAETAGRVTIDVTDFFLRDSVGVAARLKEFAGGDYALDPKRSAFFLPGLKNFPRNTEIESLLTFSAKNPGPSAATLVPDPESVTLRLRHSLVALPPPGFARRAPDPRVGIYATGHTDYSVSVGESPDRQSILRHRLAKKDPTAERSEAVAPIIYYVERDVPEPIQRALIEGVGWWNSAFEAAGYVDAFQVKVLPPGVDPLDVRYNVVAWVHHDRAAGSQGNAIIDPRTGEIIRAYVTVSSLRWQNIQRLAEGLTAPYDGTNPGTEEITRLGLLRLGHIAAHEVGHSLGFAHNFVASAQDEKSGGSIMDYASIVPSVGADGRIDLNTGGLARPGIGPWDLVSVAYAYQDFPPGTDEPTALGRILDEARGRGLHYLTDKDAFPVGGMHPQAGMLDAGRDSLAELARVMSTRSVALAGFDEAVLAPGQPLAAMEERLIPIYLLHRAQLTAVIKSIGGVHYENAVRGTRHDPPRAVPPDAQRAAVAAVLAALSPEAAGLPASLRETIPPRPAGGPPADRFDGRTGELFDAEAPPAALATVVFSALWEPTRAARLVAQNARDPASPALGEIIQSVWAATWRQPSGQGYSGEVQRIINAVALDRLIALAENPRATDQTKAEIDLELGALSKWLESARTDDQRPVAERAHLDRGYRRITSHLASASSFATDAVTLPPNRF